MIFPKISRNASLIKFLIYNFSKDISQKYKEYQASNRYLNSRPYYLSTRLLKHWLKNPSTRVLDTRRWIH